MTMRVALCAVIALCVCVLARREGPKPTFSAYGFGNLPNNVQYFPDSSVVLWHDSDSGAVFRSADEGKSWTTVKEVAGSASVLIKHPYLSQHAFVLSDGTKHWRTANRGETWQKFTTRDPPTQRGTPPLLFHGDEKHHSSIIYVGRRCSRWSLFRVSCHDTAYYTLDAFASAPKELLDAVYQCQWAKSSPDMNISEEHMNRIYCIGWDDSVKSKNRVPPETVMFVSDDFSKWVPTDLGIGHEARGYVGLGYSHGYMLTALKDTRKAGPQLSLFVSTDGSSWHRASFSHGLELMENAYTVLEGSPMRLLVDVVDAHAQTGTMYASNADGTEFIPKLNGTLRNKYGIVDYEHAATLSGIALANVVVDNKVQSRITFDDGNTWHPLKAPTYDVDHKKLCTGVDCTLHLHSVTKRHNTGRVFSSTAPGLLLGVGSVGAGLRDYADCDTYVSTDAGATWRMALRGPHKYEFGDQGALLVAVPDAGVTNVTRYSLDFGHTWGSYDLPNAVAPVVLTTVPDGTALKFLLIGTAPLEVAPGASHVATFIDFVPLGIPKCKAGDFERFYPLQSPDRCLLGRRQWYQRRKPNSLCVVGDKFHEPEAQDEPCTCTRGDYECDIGYTRTPTGECTATGAEVIPPGACQRPGDTYLGSSGYRRIPGNGCTASGRPLDKKVPRRCGDMHHTQGGALHRTYEFESRVASILHLDGLPSLFVRLENGEVFQSKDSGATWTHLVLNVRGVVDRALEILPHPKFNRVYILTEGQRVHYSPDAGRTWKYFSAPLAANHLNIPPLQLHPTELDWLIWIGSRGCHGDKAKYSNCQTEARYSTNGGRKWTTIDNYVRRCTFSAVDHFGGDKRGILCESYKTKSGAQDTFKLHSNPLQLVYGGNMYRRKEVLFPSIVGFSIFEQYMMVAALESETSFSMYASLDGRSFSHVRLPPALDADHNAYTMLDSVTRAVFLHVTTSMTLGGELGVITKSNSNGTNYVVSLENVNRNVAGYVDFEKMQGIDGIALSNVVVNPESAQLTQHKELVTRITHNDGGHWEPVTPPKTDMHGMPYQCSDVGCDLHLQGLTERPDMRIMSSTPAAAGLMLGVGNVGRALARYYECDMFITRDGGFTWEETMKGPHRWEIGDQGGIIVMVPDGMPTDMAFYSFNQGLNWTSYNLGVRLRVSTLDLVPHDTQRRFVVYGTTTDAKRRTVAVHLDFSGLASRRCVLDERRPERSDYELWSPSQQRDEPCLFGRQMWFWRRRRDRECTAHSLLPPPKTARTCACTDKDFECEYNYYRDPRGACVLFPGASPPNSSAIEQCWSDDADGFWYERTNVRKIPYSSCEGGIRPHQGAQHTCPSRPAKRGGFFSWLMFLAVIGAGGYFVITWWLAHGTEVQDHLSQYELFEDMREHVGLAFRFAAGTLSALYARAREALGRVPVFQRNERPFSSYHMLAADEDAEMLDDYDEYDE